MIIVIRGGKRDSHRREKRGAARESSRTTEVDLSAVDRHILRPSLRTPWKSILVKAERARAFDICEASAMPLVQSRTSAVPVTPI